MITSTDLFSERKTWNLFSLLFSRFRVMDVLNFNSMINHCIRKTILAETVCQQLFLRIFYNKFVLLLVI